MSELKNVMAAVNDINQSHGVTQKGGKKYTEISKRVEAFRTHFGLKYGITTNIIVDDGVRVLIKAQVYDLANTTIPVGEGYAEELRGVGHFPKGDKRNVNTGAAIENCETSAIGRALASLGLHGGQYASVNEIEKVNRNNEILEQNKEKPKDEKKPTLEETQKEAKLKLDEKIKQTEQDRKDIADGKYTPETETKSQAEWEKIHANYMRNIDELKNQSMCMHWFNRHKDVLINMHKIVPRMYGEIEENYTKKLNSFQT